MLGSKIASLYKKGDPERQENYRPIALLTCFYKIIAAALKERLQKVLEPTLLRTQYGFRPKRSTAHALQIVRRIQNRSERSGTAMHLIFLDWEKAFDKVDNHKLLLTLAEMGVDSHLGELCKSLYKYKEFMVEIDGDTSEKMGQTTGIRQGCPLSPYLFILLMDKLCRDIISDPEYPGDENTNLTFKQLLYADDTVIFSQKRNEVEKILKLFETKGLQFGLKLNYSKCVHIQINTRERVRFADGTTRVPSEEKTIYLGANINKSSKPLEEINRRIQETSVIWKKLGLLWKNTNFPTAKKIQFYNAVVRAKLAYGLETLNLHEGLKMKLRTFHLKGLRQIMKKKTTFITRRNCNDNIFACANRLCKIAIEMRNSKREKSNKWYLKCKKTENPGFELNKRLEKDPVLPIDVYVQLRAANLLGHTIRTDAGDPLKEATFDSQGNWPNIKQKNRVGRPYILWYNDAANFIWKHLEDLLDTNGPFDYKNEEHRFKILLAAENRMF